MKIRIWNLCGWIILIGLYLTGCSGCFSNKLFLAKHPKTYPDFDFRYPLDFGLGDRFEVLIDMYLFDDMSLHDDMGGKAELWELTRHTGVTNAGPLNRIVSHGETVEIMAIKMSPHQKNLFVFLRLESGEEWVINYSFEWPDGHYNRELFRKLAGDGMRRGGHRD